MNIEELKRLAEAATPGPWEIDDMLADITGIEVWSTDGMLCESISEENARYIAAANPAAVLELIDIYYGCKDALEAVVNQRQELLAALKDAREMVEDWGAYAPEYMQDKYDLQGDLDKLDAAITKAGG